jgi:hypothetical protein
MSLALLAAGAANTPFAANKAHKAREIIVDFILAVVSRICWSWKRYRVKMEE